MTSITRKTTIADRFENLWAMGMPIKVEDALQPSQLSTDEWHLVSELIQIDLEWQWKTKAERSHEAYPSTWRRRLLVEDYLLHLPPPDTTPSILDIIRTEFRVRQKFGDCPPAGEYITRFPELDYELRIALPEILYHDYPLQLICYVNQNPMLTSIVNRPLRLGRQQTHEPKSYSVVSRARETRLILADETEKTVSRNLAFIEILSRNTVSIKNLSSRSRFCVGQHSVEKGETKQVTVPFTLHAAGRQIDFVPFKARPRKTTTAVNALAAMKNALAETGSK